MEMAKKDNNSVKEGSYPRKVQLIKKIKKTIIFFIIVAVLIILLAEVSKKEQENIPPQETDNLMEEEKHNEGTEDEKGITIVIDPGHGGRDPGKIGVNGALEKDINLSIALKLRDYLINSGYDIIMTREEDIGLYSQGDSNKKATDLKKRVEIINNSGSTIAISIHQNSFPDESCKGAQVFYFATSQESEILANIMQEQIKMEIQPNNKRLAKADTSYYMLKNTNCPIIIVECGFLTNNEEAELLLDSEYQEKMAKTIYQGLDTYFKVRN